MLTVSNHDMKQKKTGSLDNVTPNVNVTPNMMKYDFLEHKIMHSLLFVESGFRLRIYDLRGKLRRDFEEISNHFYR